MFRADRRKKLQQARPFSARRRQLVRRLNVQSLEDRRMLAVNIMDDFFEAQGDITVNVLANDSSGNESQNVSSFQMGFDPATVNEGTNATDWFVPDRPGQPGVPQRSLITGAAFGIGGNFGDVDLVRDDDADPTNDASLSIAANGLFASEGVLLPVIRDNSPVDGTSANLGVPSYRTQVGSAQSTWIAIAAAPENSGENTLNVSGAFFPYSDGWVGGSYDSALNVNGGGAGLTVTAVETAPGLRAPGAYEVAVAGVTDAFSEGFLFANGGSNEDNYARTQPLANGSWSVRVRDNAAEIGGGEGTSTDPGLDAFNLLFVPRDAQGLIGGVVIGETTGPGATSYATGDFSVRRESDGLWRVSIAGESVTSGAIIAETYDLTVDQPRNAYFTYDDAGDGSGDILIRQFAWDNDTETPLNTDFVFFFVPFENQLNETHDLTLVSVDAVSAQGFNLTANPDGTVAYDSALTPEEVRALPEGQDFVDTFGYTATDGTTTQSGNATITISGFNDAPEFNGSIADIVLNEDDGPFTLDVTPFFSDIDTGDTLTFSADNQQNPLFTASMSGGTLTVTPNSDVFGTTTGVIVTATDAFGGSVSTTIPVAIIPVDDDDVVAVNDGGVTDKVTPVFIDVLGNDFHIDTTEFSAAAGIVSADPAAATNPDSVWSVDATTASPNDLTIQSPGNLGDVAVGRGGQDLSLNDGVYLGTVRENASPFGNVNAYAAFGSYGFATDTGIGGGERNTTISAGFFPFAEGWTSGHVSADGTLLGGVGVSQQNIVKIQDGLFEVSIPTITSSFEGLFFAIGGSNDDNIVSIVPKDGGFGSNAFVVRQLDNDGDVDAFENDGFSFVYLPADTPGLIGGRAFPQQGSFGLDLEYNDGGSHPITLSTDPSDGAPLVTIGGYSPADGALIAVVTTPQFVTIGNDILTVPSNETVLATPQGNSFRLDILESGPFTSPTEAPEFQFMFLPFDSPLERVDQLDFNITSFDGTSARGATITLVNGELRYDPTTGDATISGLGNGQSVTDTFSYTIEDGRGSTSTAVVTMTVQGENRAPDAINDVINLNEVVADNATLTVLGNDIDLDIESLLGVPAGIPAANLAVDASGTWTVSQTGTGDNRITLGTTAVGDVEILRDGNAIDPATSVTIATVRENADGAADNYRLVQAYPNASGGTSLAIESFGTDGDANANVSVASFRFADGWVAGHVDASGVLTSGNGLAASNVVRTAEGRYEVTVPGVTDASRDGFLFVIGHDNGDNVVQARAGIGATSYEIAVRDNQQDFGDGEDGAFSFVFVPRNAQSLVAGTIDASSAIPNASTLAVGEYTIERLDVATGGNEWRLTIPGQSPDTGMLVLTHADPADLEDNFLSYESDGSGGFIIRNHDMPSLGRQSQDFTFAFIPFDAAVQPAARPVPGLLSIQSVDATSVAGATITINADGTLNYAPGDVFATLSDGDSATDTFSYTMTDGFGGTSTAQVTVNVTGFGSAPTISLADGQTYHGIGDAPIGIDGQLDLSTTGGSFFDGAVVTVAITAGRISSDVLGLRNEGTGTSQVGVSGTDVTFEGTVIGSFAGGGTAPLVVTFNGAATEASVELVLRAITFANASSDITGGQRELTFSLVDGEGQVSAPATKSLELGLVYRRTLVQGVDTGYGVYVDMQDAQIRESDPAAVFNETGDLFVDFDGGGLTSQVLMQFDNIFGTAAGQIPSNATITSADLVLQTTNPGDGGQFYRLSIPWDESTATWDFFNQGVTIGTQAAATAESVIGTASGAGSTGTGLHRVSVLPDVRAWADGETNHGWLMDGWAGRTDGWAFRSSENIEDPATGPALQIEWLPTGLQSASFRDGVDGYLGTVDTQLNSAAPDDDLSAVETLFIDSPTTQVLIRFDDIIGFGAGQIPPNAEILSARLRTASSTSNAQGDGARFYPMLIDWSDTDTFNTLDGGVSTDGIEAASDFTSFAGDASRDPNVQGGFHDWDVAADLQAWADGDRSNFGWLFEPWVSGTDGWGIQSSDATIEAERPRLEVFFTTSTNEVTVVGTTDGEEAGPVDAVFTVSLEETSPTETVLTYNVEGTAIAGVDYVTPSGTVTIPANTLSANISITIIDDSDIDLSETLTITLDSIVSAESDVVIGEPSRNSVVILDNDGVSGLSPGDLVINEIFQNPGTPDDEFAEYVEIWNTTTQPVDIDGFVLSDNDIDSHTIDNGGPLVIPAGGYIVLGRNADTTANGGIPVDYQYANFALANDADEVILTDDFGLEIDRVEYDDGATFPDPNGASMELIPGTADPGNANDDGANWQVSTTAIGTSSNFGTPGAVNSTLGDVIAPTVVAVYAGSVANWQPSFIDAIDGGDAGGGDGNGIGYELTPGQRIPTAFVDQLTIQFSEDVSGFDAASVQVLGINTADYVASIASVTYDSVTFRGVITFSSPFVNDRIRLGVNDTVSDGANGLDGDADGSPGGVFDFRFDVLVGDGNQDGTVSSGDLTIFIASSGRSFLAAGYSALADWNGDGTVSSGDLFGFSATAGQSLPAGTPGAINFGGGSGDSGSGRGRFNEIPPLERGLSGGDSLTSFSRRVDRIFADLGRDTRDRRF